MKSKITMIGAACMLGLSAVAAPVSPEQALRAHRRRRSCQSALNDESPLQCFRHTARDARGMAAAYVFTPADGVGFTILSADDCAVPVLGYSDSGKVRCRLDAAGNEMVARRIWQTDRICLDAWREILRFSGVCT